MKSSDTSLPSNFRPLSVLFLAAGHGTVDLYASFLAPLLPPFAERFGLSLTLVGTLASILTVADGLSQPLFGYWGDRMRRAWMVAFGPACVAFTTGLLGLSTGYAMVAFLLVLSGAGRSAYHPQGAASVAQYAGRRRSFSLSIWTFAGNMGFGAGPLLVTTLITIGGLEGTLLSIPIGVGISGALYFMIFRDREFRSSTWSPPPLVSVLRNLFESRRHFSKLWIIVVLRSLTYFTLFTFLPIILTRHGLSMMETGLLTSLFLLGGAVGGIVGGWVSDRIGERTVIAGSLVLAFPALQLALITPGWAGVSFLIAGGFFLLSSAPVTIALAQRYLPQSVATASSLMLGLGWGTGGLLVTFVGMLADQIGPIAALRVVGLCLMVAALLAVWLPKVSLSDDT